MKSLIGVLSELFSYFLFSHRLAGYELKKRYAHSLLGGVWFFLHPLFQVLIYYIVFGLGIRGGKEIDQIPYFVWMLTGLIPWLWISSSLLIGSTSISSTLSIISKMNFPMSVMPFSILLGNFYSHSVLFLLLFISIFSYVHLNVYFLYYLVAAFLFLLGLTYVTSTLTALLKDFHLIYQSIIRLLFFLTPILWVPSKNINSTFQFIIDVNPLHYVINGMRQTLLYNIHPTLLTGGSLVFWGITFFLFFFGSYLHMKFRQSFLDYM